MASVKRFSRGLSLVEVMVAMVMGLMVLGATVAFLINTTKQVNQGKAQAEQASRAQQAMSRMVTELKRVNTEGPVLFATGEVWTALPALPSYSEVSDCPVVYSALYGAVDLPTVPAACQFPAQSGINDKFHKWYPNPDLGPDESNSLTFYRTEAAGPGMTAPVQRIDYRLDKSDSQNFKLVRDVQTGVTAANPNPTAKRRILTDHVKLVQFTYPYFEREMQNNTSLETQLLAVKAAQGQNGLNRYINQNFRGVVKIRLVLTGAQIGTSTKKALAIDLTTEVRVRN